MRLQQLIYQGIVWRGLYYASVFALNVVVARIYEADDSGLINYLINNLSFVLLITSLSLESALGYFASRNEISAARLTGVSLLFALLSAVASPLGVLFFAGANFYQGGTWFLVIPFVYVLGVVLTNYFSALYYAGQRVIFPNVVLIAVNILVIGFALYEYASSEGRFYAEDKIAFVVVFFSSFFVQGFILFLAWAMGHGFKLAFPSRAEFRQLFHYAFTALLANVIFFLVYRVDYWFVKSFCTNEELGNYIQVSKLGQIFLLLPSIVATAVFTRTAGGKQQNIRSVLEIISRWLLLLYLVFVFAIVITGKWLFPAIYGESFNQMYVPFLLLSPGILALSTLSLLAAFNAGRNKIGLNVKGSAIALVVIIGGNLLFVPAYGIHAAALVSSVGYICFQVYVLHQFKKEHRSNIGDFFIPKASDWQMVKQFIGQTK
jgi:O-antigen/teichoic acid export membrane protein